MIADKMIEEKPTIPDQQNPLKTNKVILPIRRTQKNENLIVGVVTYQELEATAENSNGCLNQSKSPEKNEEIAPPAVVLMNFARDTVVNKTGRLDEIGFFSFRFYSVLGPLSLDERISLRKFWLNNFTAYQITQLPKCEREKCFWEWFYMMHPDSGFKWGFKNVNAIWLDYMLTFVEFRSALKRFIFEYSGSILKEIVSNETRTKAKYLLAEVVACINDLELQLQDKMTKKAPPLRVSTKDMATQIRHSGILIEPDLEEKECTCDAQIFFMEGPENKEIFIRRAVPKYNIKGKASLFSIEEKKSESVDN